MTFCFNEFLVGIHLGQTMGAPRDDALQQADLTTYMRAVKVLIGQRPTPHCWGMFVLGAIDVWGAHPLKNAIIDGLGRWSTELTGNPQRQVYQWDDDSTANIYVHNNAAQPFEFFKANNTLNDGRVTVVQNGPPIIPSITYLF
jgi:hypothetical protein